MDDYQVIAIMAAIISAADDTKSPRTCVDEANLIMEQAEPGEDDG